jgi:hypothetical protein
VALLSHFLQWTRAASVLSPIAGSGEETNIVDLSSPLRLASRQVLLHPDYHLVATSVQLVDLW